MDSASDSRSSDEEWDIIHLSSSSGRGSFEIVNEDFDSRDGTKMLKFNDEHDCDSVTTTSEGLYVFNNDPSKVGEHISSKSHGENIDIIVEGLRQAKLNEIEDENEGLSSGSDKDQMKAQVEKSHGVVEDCRLGLPRTHSPHESDSTASEEESHTSLEGSDNESEVTFPDCDGENADEPLRLETKNFPETYRSSTTLIDRQFHEYSRFSVDKMRISSHAVRSLPQHKAEKWYKRVDREVMDKLSDWNIEKLKKFLLFVMKILGTYNSRDSQGNMYFVVFAKPFARTGPQSRSLLQRLISEAFFATISIALFFYLYEQDVQRCIRHVLYEYLHTFELYRQYEPYEDIFLVILRQGKWDPLRDTTNPLIRRLIRMVESWDIKHSIGRMRQVFPWSQRLPHGFMKNAFLSMLSIVHEEVDQLKEPRRQKLVSHIWRRVGKFIPTHFKGQTFVVRRDYKYRVLIVGLSVEKIRTQCCSLLIAEGILAWVAFHMVDRPLYGKPLKEILRRHLRRMMRHCT